MIELQYFRQIHGLGANVRRRALITLTCVVTFAGLGHSVAFGNDDANDGDRLRALVKNGNRVLHMETGKKELADLHRACVLKRRIPACDQIIDNVTSRDFASPLDVGTAYLTRGAWRDARGERDAALADFDQAAQLTKGFPKLQVQIENLKRAFSTTRTYTEFLASRNQRAIATINWDDNPFRHPWIGATQAHDARLENSSPAAANSMSMDGVCDKAIFLRPYLCRAPRYSSNTPPVAFVFAHYRDKNFSTIRDESSAIVTGALPDRRAPSVLVTWPLVPKGQLKFETSAGQRQSGVETAMLVPKSAAESGRTGVVEQLDGVYNVRAGPIHRPSAIRDDRPASMWSPPRLAMFLLVLALCGLGIVVTSKRSKRQEYGLEFQKLGPLPHKFASVQNFSTRRPPELTPASKPTPVFEPSPRSQNRLVPKSLDRDMRGETINPVSVGLKLEPAKPQPIAVARVVAPRPSTVRPANGADVDESALLRIALTPQELDRFVDKMARDICVEALRKSDNLAIGDRLALCMFDVSRQLILAELGSQRNLQFSGVCRDSHRSNDEHGSRHEPNGGKKPYSFVSEEWTVLLHDIWVTLLNHLPNDALTVTMRSTSRSEAIEVRLIQLVERPLGLLGALEKHVCSDTATRTGYFTELRDALAGNLQSVVRVIGDGNGETTVPAGLDAGIGTSSDLEQVRHFLRSTPFRAFLETKVVSMPIIWDQVSNCRIIAAPAASRSVLIAQLFAPQLPQIELGEATGVFVDSRAGMAEDIRRAIKQNSTSPMGHGLRVIKPSSPTDSGLFNPFGFKLDGFDPLTTEKLLGAAFDLQCFVFESFLGTDFTQDHRSDLRHIMRLHHNIPNASFETLIELLEPGSLGTYEKYVKSIASASSRDFFDTTFRGYKFRKVADGLRRKLEDLISSDVFKSATCGRPWGGIGNAELAAGKTTLYDLRCGEICYARQQVLKRICISKIAFEALIARESANRSDRLHLYMDDFGDLFDGCAADLDMIFEQLGKCDSEIVIGYDLDNRLTPKVQEVISRYCPAKFEGVQHPAGAIQFNNSSNSFLSSLRAARGGAPENGFVVST